MRHTILFLIFAGMLASCSKDNSALIPEPGIPEGISATGTLYRLDSDTSVHFSIATGAGSTSRPDCAYGNWLIRPQEPPYSPSVYHTFISSTLWDMSAPAAEGFSARFLLTPNLLGRSYLSRDELVDFFQVGRVIPVGDGLEQVEIACKHPFLPDLVGGANKPGSGTMTVRAVDDLDWENRLERLRAIRVTFDVEAQFNNIQGGLRDGQVTLFFTYRADI